MLCVFRVWGAEHATVLPPVVMKERIFFYLFYVDVCMYVCVCVCFSAPLRLRRRCCCHFACCSWRRRFFYRNTISAATANPLTARLLPDHHHHHHHFLFSISIVIDSFLFKLLLFESLLSSRSHHRVPKPLPEEPCPPPPLHAPSASFEPCTSFLCPRLTAHRGE